MTKTELSLEVSDGFNPKVMRLFDTSFYSDSETIENYLIEVLPVNKNVWVAFHIAKNFSLILNSSNLRYKKVTENSQLIDIPDGIYEIKQSFKPNIHTLVHFYHLRTTDLKAKLKAEWKKLVCDECKISREEFYRERDKLREIDEYVLAAKFQVEECLDKTKGKELYDFSKKLLEIYTNECKC